MGYTDRTIADLTGRPEAEIKALRRRLGITPDFKMVDTCAAEFEAVTPYYYSTYSAQNEVNPRTSRRKVMVLGSGPIRIGQGIEFDYCSVHSVWALKEMGCETIIVNNNPETVSTDFDIADKLYFEPLTREDVGNIVDLEKPDGAVVQFGGQTAIKLTKALVEMGVPILGTSERDIDRAEDREEFDKILESCGIPRPAGHTVFTLEEALGAARDLGYPVLVRPSYVLGGQGMEIARSDADIREFLTRITALMEVKEHPILVDKYVEGQECEVDAVCDGEDILVPGIMEHLERAGVHSGDSISVYPAQSLPHADLHAARRALPRPGARPARPGPDQHPVHRQGRPRLRHRGQPALLAHGSLHLQGHGRADRQARNARAAGRAPARHGLWHGPVPEEPPRRGQDARLLL